MKLLIMLTLLSSVGCQSDDFRKKIYDDPDPTDPRTGNEVAREFDEFVSRFESDFDLAVGDIPISFGDIDSAGVCFTHTFSSVTFKEIVIDRDYYDLIKYSDLKVEQLVYHELGHCRLNLEHNDEVCGLMPMSIMRATAFSRFEINMYYRPEHKHYLDELDGRITTCPDE